MRRTTLTAALTAVLVAVTPPAATRAATVDRCPQYEPAIARYLPKRLVPVFSRIAYRESRCNPRSVSEIRHTGYPDVGLLQIQGDWRTVTIRICRPKGSHLQALQRVDCNLRVARYLYDNGGLGHWRATVKK